MKLKIFSVLVILCGAVSALAQSKVVTAPNGLFYEIKGTDGFRNNDELWLYTAAFYAKKPPSNAGIDVHVVENKVVENSSFGLSPYFRELT